MAKYKIVRKYGANGLEWFYVYKKRPLWIFGWSLAAREFSQKEAEDFIGRKKRAEENLKKKPEVIGYY